MFVCVCGLHFYNEPSLRQHVQTCRAVSAWVAERRDQLSDPKPYYPKVWRPKPEAPLVPELDYPDPPSRSQLIDVWLDYLDTLEVAA